jgi:arsenate reductase-like glutaredoxin family protein
MDMDSINTSKEYATLFVNHDNRLSQKAEAFVKAQNKFVNVIDVKRQRITPTQLIEMVRNCNAKMNQLFDRTSDFYQEKVHHTSNYTEADLAQMLTDQPDLLRTPFVVKGNTMKFFETSKDLTMEDTND